MPTTYKVLGQQAPGAATPTALYTCPSGASTVLSTIAICNRATPTSTFRLYIRPDNEALSNKHYLIYDASITSRDTLFLTIGATLDASDVIYCYSSSADLSFNAFGSEIT